MGYRYPRIGYPFITDTSKKLVSRLCPAFNSHNVVSRWTCRILHLFHHVYPIVSFFSFLHPYKFFANLADISLAIQCSKFERNIHSSIPTFLFFFHRIILNLQFSYKMQNSKSRTKSIQHLYFLLLFQIFLQRSKKEINSSSTSIH